MKTFSHLLLFAAAVTMACSSNKPKSDIPSAGWQSRMQGFSATVTELYPLVVSQKEYNNPANYKKIEQDTDTLAVLAHDISGEAMQKDVAKVDTDPSVKYIANSLKRSTQTASEALKAGNRDYARVVLKGALNTCVQCHTRGRQGPEFFNWLDASKAPYLTRLERGDLLASTRNYHQAFELYLSMLQDPELAKAKPFEWATAADNALNIAIRVNSDPDAALMIINTIEKTDSAPRFLRGEAGEWKKFVTDWRNNPKTDMKPAEKFREAKKILGAIAKDELFPTERENFVDYLRASSLLHEYLRSGPSPKATSEAFYLLGQAYEGVEQPSQGRMDEVYYKACINSYPHSSQAMKCFKRYQENTFVDTLRSGTSLPMSELDYMNVLEQQATPQTPRAVPGDAPKGR